MIKTDVNRYGATQITLAQALRSEPADPAKTSAPSGDEPRTAGPAVVLSLSPTAKAAMDRLKGDDGASPAIASRLKYADGVPLRPEAWLDTTGIEKAAEESSALFLRFSELFSQKGEDHSKFSEVLLAKELLSENVQMYNRYLTIKPVPAVVLEGKEKEAALKIASDQGLSIGGYDTLGFGDENYVYTVYKDGTVTRNDGDTPTSEQSKQQTLESLKKWIDLAQTDTTDYDKRTAVRDKELAELTAVLGLFKSAGN
ncbi:hypothetical protein [Methylobacterium sp. CM6247]